MDETPIGSGMVDLLKKFGQKIVVDGRLTTCDHLWGRSDNADIYQCTKCEKRVTDLEAIKYAVNRLKWQLDNDPT